MIRALALVVALLAAGPAFPQDAAIPAAADPAPDAVEAPEVAAPDPAVDPVGAWQADARQVLPADAVVLEDFRYLARPLVVFADSPRQPQLLEQLRLIQSGLGDLAERDVAVILDTDPAARSAARQALRPRGFGIVLLDMDGRVLLRRPDPTDAREIGRTIDRSPIRQEEIRQGPASEGGG